MFRLYFVEIGLLKWFGRVDFGFFFKLDFLFFLNFVIYFEISLFVCFFFLQLDLDFLIKSIVFLEVFEDLGFVCIIVVYYYIEGEKEEWYFLFDFINVLFLMFFVNVGYVLLLRCYIQDDYDDGYVVLNECERVVFNVISNFDLLYVLSFLVEDVFFIEVIDVKEFNVFIRKVEIE